MGLWSNDLTSLRLTIFVCKLEILTTPMVKGFFEVESLSQIYHAQGIGTITRIKATYSTLFLQLRLSPNKLWGIPSYMTVHKTKVPCSNGLGKGCRLCPCMTDSQLSIKRDFHFLQFHSSTPSQLSH
jgi:hypothetical protein